MRQSSDRDAALDSRLLDATDATPWDRVEASVDATLDGGVADVAPLDSGTDATTIDVAVDAPCTQLAAVNPVADLIVVQGSNLNLNIGDVLNASSDLPSDVVARFTVPDATAVSRANRMRVLLPRMVSTAGPPDSCGGRCPHTPGQLDLYTLGVADFVETQANWFVAATGRPWSIGVGGSDRGARVGSASVLIDSVSVEFDITGPSLASMQAAFIGSSVALLVQPITPAVYCSRPRELPPPNITLILEVCP